MHYGAGTSISKRPTSQKRHQPVVPLRFQELEKVAGIRPKSVNLILVDPPYGKDFLPELPDLPSSQHEF